MRTGRLSLFSARFLKFSVLCLILAGFAALSSPLAALAATPKTKTAERKTSAKKDTASTGSRRVSRAESELGQARESYARIKREDNKVSNLELWERAAAKFSKVLAGRPEADVKAEALGTLGDIYANIYQQKGSTSALSKAVYYYEQMSREFEGDERVPPKLLGLANLRRDGLKDEPGARAAYYELIDLYPGSRQLQLIRRI